MTRFYLDTSVAVHALRGTPAAEAWFDAATADGTVDLVSSRILQTELTRVLRRDGLPVAERDLILRHLALLHPSELVLTAAEAISEHVKTLDAIHLASALAFGSETVVVTHDDTVTRISGVLGLHAFDPLA